MHALLTGAESDSLFLTLIETAVDGIIVIHTSGSIQVFNPACERLFGYTPEEALGQNISILMPSPYREMHDRYVGNYVATGERKIIGIGREVVGQRKDGSTFPMYLSVGEGKLNGARIFVGIIHDITARRDMERRLNELQSELSHVARLSVVGEMSAALAHELNQPLAAALNYANTARRLLVQTDDARVGDMMEKAAAQVSRAGQILRSLREFITKAEPVRAPEDLNAAVAEALDISSAGARERGILVERQLAPGLPFVLMDRIQIQQVIVNLVRNAFEAVEDQEVREVAVVTRMRDGMVEILVADSGAGIAADIGARLFRPFTTSKAMGLGIGLAICKSIIEAHGGEIASSAEDALSMGRRTCFSVRLPDGRTE